MTNALTDKKAIRLALECGIEWERSLLAAAAGDRETAERCRSNIKAFERVLKTYFGGRRSEPTEGAKLMHVLDSRKNSRTGRDSDGKVLTENGISWLGLPPSKL